MNFGMFIYLFILFLLYILGFIELKGGLKGRHGHDVFIVIIILFWFLSFTRWETGTDWAAYYDFFRSNYTLLDFQNRLFEPLYTYIAYLVKLFTNDYWVLLLVYSSIIYLLVVPTISKYSPLPFISLILYFLLRKADIFFTRESIGLAFCLFSIRYIENRKLLPFVFTILLGALFHKSVIVFLPAYFIYALRLRIKTILYIVAAFFIISFVSLDWIRNSMLSISSMLGDAFFDKTDAYMDKANETFGYGVSLRRSMIQGFINNGFFMFLFAYTLRTYNTTFINGLFNLFAFSLIIFFITLPLNLTLARIFNSYNLVSIILIGYTFKCFSNNKLSLFYNLFFIYICVRFTMQTFLGGYSYCFVPFKSILW